MTEKSKQDIIVRRGGSVSVYGRVPSLFGIISSATETRTMAEATAAAAALTAGTQPKSERRFILLKEEENQSLGLLISTTSPYRIEQIEYGGIACLAGLLVGDTLKEINGHRLHSIDYDTLQNILSTSGIVTMTIERTYSTSFVNANSSTFNDEYFSESLLSGYLRVCTGEMNMFTRWKNRWCILTKGNCLYLSKDHQNADHPDTAIMLAGYSLTRTQSRAHEHCFKITKPGCKSYSFAATNNASFNMWGKHIEAAIQQMKSYVEKSCDRLELPALSILKPECHGYLNRQEAFKIWLKRYYVLKDNILYYYKNISDITAIGVIHLHGYTLVEQAADGTGKAFAFELARSDGKYKSYRFAVASQADYDRWTAGIRKSLEKWTKLA